MNPDPNPTETTDPSSDDTITIHIVVDHQTKRLYLDLPDTEPNLWLARIHRASWITYLTAHDTIQNIVNEAVEASGRDRDGRLPEPCDQWQGHQAPAHTTWTVAHPDLHDDAPNPWPTFRTEAEAHQFVAQLQQSASGTGGHLTVIAGWNRATPLRLDTNHLVVHHHDHASNSGSCDRCGWSHDEHAEASVSGDPGGNGS